MHKWRKLSNFINSHRYVYYVISIDFAKLLPNYVEYEAAYAPGFKPENDSIHNGKTLSNHEISLTQNFDIQR